MKLSDLIYACKVMKRQHGDIEVFGDIDEDHTGTPNVMGLEYNPYCRCEGDDGRCNHGPWIGVRFSYDLTIEVPFSREIN